MGKANRKIRNKAFNRFEKGGHHFYVKEYPQARTGDSKFEGLIKCKLVHGKGYSIIVPDFIFVNHNNRFHWFQIIFFNACLLGKDHDEIGCIIPVDVAHGNRLKVIFNNKRLETKYEDGSELFSCEIFGPNDIIDFSTGIAEVIDNNIFVPLFHHTTRETIAAIAKSKFFYPSKWNIQGNKELQNVGYVYFSCLTEIKAPEDLLEIAMAHDGVIYFLVDDGYRANPADVLALEVYRDTTANRTHTIRKLVPISCLATKPVLNHRPAKGEAYYEFVAPFIYRVGIEPSECLYFDGVKILSENVNIKHFEYAIVGDARTIDGIKAPYDEEDTTEILKVEKTQNSSTILDFWFENSNLDHFTGKSIELLKF